MAAIASAVLAKSSKSTLIVSFNQSVARCPYLEQIYKERRGPVRVYHFDCHVDHRSKRRVALHESPPICVRNFEDCPLYQEERRREDGIIHRYTD